MYPVVMMELLCALHGAFLLHTQPGHHELHVDVYIL